MDIELSYFNNCTLLSFSINNLYDLYIDRDIHILNKDLPLLIKGYFINGESIRPLPFIYYCSIFCKIDNLNYPCIAVYTSNNLFLILHSSSNLFPLYSYIDHP